EAEALAEAERCLNCGCYAVNPSDLAAVLVLLNARFVTTERTLSADELICGGIKPQDVLREGELIKEIRIPKMGGELRYDKKRVRDAVDFAIVALASRFEVKDGVIEEAGLVLGAVAQTPRRLPEVDAFLKGKKISEELAREASELALKDAVPMGRNEYKIFMAKDVVYKAVLRAGGLAKEYKSML
ncbi:MAG: pyridine nucleotide-disulfide oxidoreductase, partial [Oscillospiraceae bacterium]|nr:pyridine nucleotide-disulfide oxidoreductase [Oscillospiraceae bacterium]